MFKIHLNGVPPIFSSHFESHNTMYKFKTVTTISVSHFRTLFHMSESLSFLVQKWDLVPTELKQLKNIVDFKAAFKKWQPLNCPCILYKNMLLIRFYLIDLLQYILKVYLVLWHFFLHTIILNQTVSG